ncbi:MAG: FecR domain-containing protein [bacterium]
MMVPECCFSEWEQEIWLYFDNELSEEQRLRVERHLEKCRRCREFVADVRPLEDRTEAHFLKACGENTLPKDFNRKVLDRLPSMVSIPVHRRIWLAVRRILTIQGACLAMRRHPVTVAALILLCVGSLFSTWLGRVEYDYPVKVIADGERAFLVRLSENIVCDDPSGQLYELPDGSLIYAEAGAVFSIETYQKRGDDRWISLKRGDVWFSVETDPREGFTVSTPQALLKVMGTCFAVSLENRKTHVEVAHGSVLIENVGRKHPKSCRLKPGKEITADRRGRLVEWGQMGPGRVEQLRTLFDAARSAGCGELIDKNSDALFTVPKH